MMLPKPVLESSDLFMVAQGMRHGTDIDLATPGAATVLMTGSPKSRFGCDQLTQVAQGNRGVHVNLDIVDALS